MPSCSTGTLLAQNLPAYGKPSSTIMVHAEKQQAASSSVSTMLHVLQKSKKQKAPQAAPEAVQANAIAAVSADPAADPVVIVKKDADSSAVLVSSNGQTEQVKLEQTASGEPENLCIC